MPVDGIPIEAPDPARAVQKSTAKTTEKTVESAVAKSSRFRPKLPTGIHDGWDWSLHFAGAALLAGSRHHPEPRSSSPGTDPSRSREEHTDEQLTVSRQQSGNARVRTHVRISDASLNHRHIDDGLAHYARHGVAYSRS
jgi:hypothetical protein